VAHVVLLVNSPVFYCSW